MDVHSLWYNELQAIIDGHTGSHGEDNMIHQILAMNMLESAEKTGHPFMITDFKNIKKVLAGLGYNNFLCDAFYDKVHSLVFGLELSHFNWSPLDVKNSGVACVSALLKAGNQRFSWQKDSGYPNHILFGDLFTSIRAAGKNSGERRRSRAEIWKNRKYFQRPARIRMRNDNIKVKTEYSGENLSSGLEITSRIRKDYAIKDIFLNRKKVDEFVTFQDRSSTYVSIPIKTIRKGKYELTIES